MTFPTDIVAVIVTGRHGVARARAKDRKYVSVQYVVQMTTTVGTPAVMRFNTAGRISDAIYSQPLLLSPADVVCDDGANSTFTFTLVADRTVAVKGAAWERYDTLHDLLAAHPEFAAGATVQLWAEIMAEDDATIQYHDMMTGVVNSVLGVTPGSVTFLVIQTDVFELTNCPSLTITDAPTDGISGAAVLPTAGGKPVPVSLGGFQTPICGIWSANDNQVPNEFEWFQRNLGAFGLRMPTVPAVPWYKYRGNNGFLLNRAGYVDPTRAFPEHDGIYIRLSGDQLGRFYSHWKVGQFVYGPDNVLLSTTTDHAHTIRERFPWIQVPLKLKPVCNALIADAASKATDGDPNTSLLLEPGGYMDFEIVSSGNYGRISMNSTDAGTGEKDYDGETAPVGLKILVLLAAPPGSDLPGGGSTFNVKMTYPNHGTIFGADYSFVPPSAATLPGLVACQVNLPGDNGTVLGTTGAGWIGTKFHQWDFTTTTGRSDVETLANDTPLWNGSGDGKVQPFLIRVTNNETGASVRVVAVTLLVGCQYGIDLGAPTLETKFGMVLVMPRTIDQETGRVYSWVLRPEAGRVPFLRPNRPYAGPNPDAKIVQIGEFTPKDLSIVACRPTYWDNAAGDYTRTPYGKLTEPLSFMLWLLVNEGDIAWADIETEYGAFGSASDVRVMLAKWWRSGTAEWSPGWSANFTLLTPGPLRAESLDPIGQHCLGLHCRKMPNGKYGFFLWGPMDLIGDTINAYTSGASGQRTGTAPARSITIGRQVLASDVGCSLELWPGSHVNVVNSIEIRYGVGSKRLAVCNSTKSDDGTGAVWGYRGYAPFTGAAGGLTAQAICAWSVGRYGARKPLKLDLPEIEHPQVAVQVGLYYLLSGYRPPINWRLISAGIGMIDVWPGHILRFDDDLMERGNFRFPLDDSASPQLWSTKSFLCTRSQHMTDGFSRQQCSGIMLPTRFALETITDGNADMTPWVPPVPGPTESITIGGPYEWGIDRNDDTVPVPA